MARSGLVCTPDFEAVAGTNTEYWALIEIDGTPIVQADVSSISIHGYDVLSSTPNTDVFTPITITVASAIFDTLQQSDDPWTYRRGWNFNYVLPGSNITASSTYRIEIIITTAAHGDIVLLYDYTAIENRTLTGSGNLFLLDDGSFFELDDGSIMELA